MTKLTLILTCLCLAVGCNRKANSIIDPDFQSYYDAFQDAADSRGVDASATVIVLYGDPTAYCTATPGSKLIGCCHATNPASVSIDRAEFAKLDTENRELIIFHELGHCLLGRSHRTDSDRGIPESIMTPNPVGAYLPDAYHDFRESYRDELFGKIKTINFGF